MSVIAAPRFLFCFRGDSSPKKNDKHSPDLSPAEDEPRFEAKILCASCRALITFRETGMEVNGSFEHTFCNPHGVVFRIGCFSHAPGCKNVGIACSDFTWFPGFLWRIVCCHSCQTHVGWLFQGSGGGQFYGLILDKLVEEPEGE